MLTKLQAVPPVAAAVVMMYDVFWVPPPHVLVQVVGVVQLAAQFTGHACVLQDVVLTVLLEKLQLVPPYAAGVVTTKVEVDVPPPQVLLQVVQDVQLPLQLIGHGCELQIVELTVLLANLQAVPPFEAFLTMVYVWLVVPPPHGAVQLLALVQ